MTKEYIHKKRITNPDWYKQYLKKKREKYNENLKKDPIRYEKYLKRKTDNQRKRRKKKRLETLEYKKTSPYWQRKVGYDRYSKHNTFKRLSNNSNRRCKKNKTNAFLLWCLAKKQKLICPITGEKLTKENISVDHKIPISKGGTNDISNLQLITRQSNSIKHTMTMNDFYLFCKKIVDRFAPIGEGSTTPQCQF